MNFAPFAGLRFEVALDAAGSAPLVIEPLPPQAAPVLGGAFAAVDPWATYGFSAETLATYFAALEPGAPRFLLTRGGEVAGALGVRLAWLRGPYVQFLGVLPEMQRQGIGSAALNWVERQARAGKERNLWIAASQINTQAINLYERLGFRDAAWLDSLLCEGRTEILMRKRLA